MKRKIIQILFSKDDTLHALCNDGTIWYYAHGEWLRYTKLIPQN
jgi:hypothetical protein